MYKSLEYCDSICVQADKLLSDRNCIYLHCSCWGYDIMYSSRRSTFLEEPIASNFRIQNMKLEVASLSETSVTATRLRDQRNRRP
jgi:hypothetical protein